MDGGNAISRWLGRFIPLLACMLAFTPSPCAARNNSTQHGATFNDYILYAVRTMPRGGGYSTGRDAAENLSDKGVVWDERQRRLTISPHHARPSFCSSACYLALLKALQHCENRKAIPPLPSGAWKSMDIRMGQLDGEGVWGRANANGPGFAKLIKDLNAGINFSDIRYARPGDFMKIFWNDQIGKYESGHLVIFLRTYKAKTGQTIVEFWSSNMGLGYSVKSVDMATVSRAIFTRVQYPARFSAVESLPLMDEWLYSLLTSPVSYSEVRKKCRIR